MPRQRSLYENEPLMPPHEGQVIRICRWPDVFEKVTKSRTYKSLSWISCPVSFNSTGYQKLLDSFDGMEAAALYGGWLALCQLAAQSDLRGRLCGQKGEPYNTRRIARLTGLPVDVFELLIPWALSVEWLEWALPSDPYDSPDTDPQRPSIPTSRRRVETSLCESTPADVIDSGQRQRSERVPDSGTIPGPTQHDLTEQNTTPPPTACAGGGEGLDSRGTESLIRDWESIRQQLEAFGVKANRKAVASAKASGWSIDHASAVLAEFKSAAWDGFSLKLRFEQPAAVAPTEGWPPVSQEYEETERSRRKIRAAERQSAALRNRPAKVADPQAAKAFNELVQQRLKAKVCNHAE